MSNKTFNPYPTLTTNLISGLNTVGSKLNTITSEDVLVDVIYSIIAQEFYPTASAITEIELRALIAQTVGFYQNDPYSFMNDVVDEEFLETVLLVKEMVPVKSTDVALIDIKEQLLTNDLSFEEREPALLAILFSIEIEKYWKAQITTPNPWTIFRTSDFATNLAELPFWVDACAIGSLVGYSLALNGAVSPTIDVRSTSLISALTGALIVGSGKVIFKWVPKEDITYGGQGMKGIFGTRTGGGSYVTWNEGAQEYQNTPYKYDKSYNRRPTRYFF